MGTGYPARRCAIVQRYPAGMLLGSTAIAAASALRPYEPSRVRDVATAVSVAFPASASAASVTYDFGYRIERAIDPDKRGPAEDFGGGMDALMRMCEPPDIPEAASAEQVV